MATIVVFKGMYISKGYDTNKVEEMNPIHGNKVERQAKPT